MSEISAVKDYWEAHPLFSYEVKYELGSLPFFKEMDRIKLEDAERFSMQYWDFSGFQEGQSLLDIGCGPGFLTRHFASKGYKVTAVDLSEKAVILTRKSLELYRLHAEALNGNAENLEFKDDSFDYIVSSGVLHHTPDTRKAVLEAYRVLKPGGRAKITLYYKNILLREPFWSVTKLLAKNMLKNIPGRESFSDAEDQDQFIRIYDGDTNPVGKGYTVEEAKKILTPPFFWVGYEIHLFPARFMPKWLPINKTMHKFLDARIGTMIYINLKKA
jgi:ubiquinone/menaquinone biosynthesis C-methylase UbiE